MSPARSASPTMQPTWQHISGALSPSAHDPQGEVHFINMAPRMRTSETGSSWSSTTSMRLLMLHPVAVARTGNSMRNVEPRLIVDSTQMHPPCISTICLSTASPSLVRTTAELRPTVRQKDRAPAGGGLGAICAAVVFLRRRASLSPSTLKMTSA